MKKIFYLIILLVWTTGCNNETAGPNEADIIIYGGTSAGVAAAIQASRVGKSVILIEPTNRLGGLTTGGLGQTDIGNKQAIGGISREFYENIKKYYDNPESWKWQERSSYMDGGQTRTEEGEATMWTFEPSAALKVYHQMIEKEKMDIRYGQRLDRSSGVVMNGTRIASITMESGEAYTAKMFIDATYEGDLLAAAGVSYTVGREANSQYGETLNGVQPSDTSRTITGMPSRNGMKHNFVQGVDPYVVPGDPTSGLLPGINPEPLAPEGTGDNKIQAYCYRMCLTDHPDNRIPFEKPKGYDEINYELLFRNYEARKGEIRDMYSYGKSLLPWINSSMPNRKTDTNNKFGFSTDYIGKNYDYPEASYAEREKMEEEHRNYQKGLMWSLANHPRIPEEVREEASRWGTSKDEFERADGWQKQLYVREARRMIGAYVMTQKNCEGIIEVEDPIGMAAYGMDSHNVQRYVTDEGYVRNEGNVEAHVKSPYPISYRSLIPKAEECTNLLVPVCLSATHIAFGSIRMEPVFMVLGQSATLAAAVAIDEGKDVQGIDYKQLNSLLLKNKQRLTN